MNAKDDLDSKDIYLRKGEEIVGLHAIGHKMDYEYTLVHLDGTEEIKKSDFMEIERWGNEYDNEYNMMGRGSFRVHADIEEVAKELELDGWIRFERK